MVVYMMCRGREWRWGVRSDGRLSASDCEWRQHHWRA